MKEMCEKNWNCASKSIKILICQKSAKDGCEEESESQECLSVGSDVQIFCNKTI